MRQLSDKKLATWQTVLLSFASTCIILYILLLKYGVCFETNDDRIFSEIFSGVLTGTPNAYGIYINYLLGKFISTLFGITKTVQWYGLFLICCFGAIYTSLTTVVLQNCNNILEQICFLVLSCFLIVANIYVFTVIQFTTVAGALAAAGYCWLLLDKNPVRKYVGFGVFESIAILLRQDSMFLVQPIGVSVVAAFLLVRFLDNRQEFKACLKEGIQCLLLIGAVILFAYIGNYVIGDYSSAEWKAYTEYNNQNVELADYYGYPEYEQCKDICDKYDVTEAEYHALKRYLVLDNKFEPGFMEEISNMAQSNHKEDNPFSFVKIIKRVITYPKYDDCYGYEISVPILYIVAGLFILLFGQKKYIFPIMALFGSKNLMFAYLIYRGRLPHRVVNILWFTELLVLSAIIICIFLDKSKKYCSKRVILGIAFGVIVAFCCSAKIGSEIAQTKNTSKIAYAESMQKLFDYCAESEDGVLLIDDVTTYYTGHVLDTKHYQSRVSLVTGGWFSNSPTMDEAVETYRNEHTDGMKCIVFSEDMNVDNTYILKFFEEMYGEQPKLVDKFGIDELGLSYAVYQLY